AIVEQLASGETHAGEDERGKRGKHQHARRPGYGDQYGIEHVADHVVPSRGVILLAKRKGGEPASVQPLDGILEAEHHHHDHRIQAEREQDQQSEMEQSLRWSLLESPPRGNVAKQGPWHISGLHGASSSQSPVPAGHMARPSNSVEGRMKRKLMTVSTSTIRNRTS